MCAVDAHEQPKWLNINTINTPAVKAKKKWLCLTSMDIAFAPDV
jgi:hypothetical protein